MLFSSIHGWKNSTWIGNILEPPLYPPDSRGCRVLITKEDAEGCIRLFGKVYEHYTHTSTRLYRSPKWRPFADFKVAGGDLLEGTGILYNSTYTVLHIYCILYLEGHSCQCLSVTFLTCRFVKPILRCTVSLAPSQPRPESGRPVDRSTFLRSHVRWGWCGSSHPVSGCDRGTQNLHGSHPDTAGRRPFLQMRLRLWLRATPKTGQRTAALFDTRTRTPGTPTHLRTSNPGPARHAWHIVRTCP